MPMFILMTQLTSSEMKDAGHRRDRGREFIAAVADRCPGVNWISHYALLGRFDFMDIYEAPDEATAFEVSLISRSLGATRAESWLATDYESHLKLMEGLE